MGDVVNLRRFKKRLERKKSAEQADVNRVRHGRSKSERIAERERTNRADEVLDQHRIDGGDAS